MADFCISGFDCHSDYVKATLKLTKNFLESDSGNYLKLLCGRVQWIFNKVWMIATLS